MVLFLRTPFHYFTSKSKSSSNLQDRTRYTEIDTAQNFSNEIRFIDLKIRYQSDVLLYLIDWFPNPIPTIFVCLPNIRNVLGTPYLPDDKCSTCFYI